MNIVQHLVNEAALSPIMGKTKADDGKFCVLVETDRDGDCASYVDGEYRRFRGVRAAVYMLPMDHAVQALIEFPGCGVLNVYLCPEKRLVGYMAVLEPKTGTGDTGDTGNAKLLEMAHNYANILFARQGLPIDSTSTDSAGTQVAKLAIDCAKAVIAGTK